MTVIANAKLNLYLDISGTRSDGYHTLETVMQSVTLSDIVTVDIQDADGISLTCDAPLIPTDKRNIAYKAAERYLAAARLTAMVNIDIQKRIPSGAGMGGGSADAAAVLYALDKHFGALPQDRLYDVALSIGADVPFCLSGGTKVCKGIGEDISDCPEVKGCFFLVVMPDFTCPTGAAYKQYDNDPVPPQNGLDGFIEEIQNGSFPEKMYNTFELLYADPRIESIKQKLVSAGARGAMLTGSGAAVFGVFSDRDTAVKAAERLPLYFTAVCEPTSRAVTTIEI